MARYKIIELIVEMNPKYPTLLNQGKPYLFLENNKDKVDFIIEVSDDEIKSAHEAYPHLSLDNCEYMLYGSKFYKQLLRYNAFMLHSSCVCLDNKAYIFSAPSGTGKSTHTKLWLEVFPSSFILNDDKPAIYIKDNEVFACGTPFSGKTDLNCNKIIKLQGIAFLKRGKTNKIKEVKTKDVLFNILNQTLRPDDEENMNCLLILLDKLASRVKCYELECNMEKEAASVAYEGMKG